MSLIISDISQQANMAEQARQESQTAQCPMAVRGECAHANPSIEAH